MMLLACSNLSKKKKKSPTNQIDNTDLYDFKIKVLTAGDTNAYNELSLKYTVYSIRPWDLLYYSQLMCNKYHYSNACLQCYFINHEDYLPENLKSKDSTTYAIGIYYLLKAKEYGCKSALYYIDRHFPDTIPSSNNYLVLKPSH